MSFLRKLGGAMMMTPGAMMGARPGGMGSIMGQAMRRSARPKPLSPVAPALPAMPAAPPMMGGTPPAGGAMLGPPGLMGAIRGQRPQTPGMSPVIGGNLQEMFARMMKGRR